jgi:L-amino acid N-acyltransferase YncA
MDIRPFAPGDEVAISQIYNPYITGTTVTFEVEPLSAQAMRERIDSYRQHFPWLVCVIDGQVVGYGYASRFHPLAAIALPHAASVGLHESLGFAKVAHFSEVGRKFGQWIDVGYWQLKL